MNKMENNILIAHNDWDGWCSAAILYNIKELDQYYFITNNRIFNLLNYIANISINFDKITVFILDLNFSQISIQKLVRYLNRLKKKNILFIWVDHHETLSELRNFKYNRMFQTIILPQYETTASIMLEFFNNTNNPKNLKRFVEFARYPGYSRESKYWYKVLQNLKSIKFRFGYRSLVKIIFNLFAYQKPDNLTDFIYNLDENTINSINTFQFHAISEISEISENQINSEISILKTVNNYRLLIIEDCIQRDKVFKLLDLCDLLLIFYKSGKIGCYSSGVSLRPLFKKFNATGHDTACIFDPFIEKFDNFAEYIPKEELIRQIRTLF